MARYAPGTPDPAILSLAQDEERVLLTFDTGFGDLVFIERRPAYQGVILLRLGTTSPSVIAPILLLALRERTEWAGYFWVVNRNRTRGSPLP